VAKDQACKLQILSVKHKDILVAVNGMFSQFATLDQVREMIELNYHEKIANSTISRYKKKHFNAHLERVREQKNFMRAVAQLVGEDGLTAGVNALLWQGLQTMTMAQLVSFKKVMNDAQKVELMKKQFALYAQEHRLKMKERAAALEADQESSGDPGEDYAKAQRVVQQVKEIFGIGISDVELPGQPLLGPAAGAPQEASPAGGEPVRA
jgi:hypothetical protein